MTTQVHSNLVILRRREVEVRTGLSRSSIYKRINMGTFPKQISLGGKSVGWVESEIDNFLADRIAERDDRSRLGSKG